MIEARVIADSVTEQGHRLTTIEATYPRFIHSEVMTHRVLSKNSASSRAIPVTKQIEKVIANPAAPVRWASEQKGMQGGDEIDDVDSANYQWLKARDDAVASARILTALGVHKSVTNRILEPYMWMTTILSGTSWRNFLNLRDNDLAQPEFQVLASKIGEALDGSEPTLLRSFDWHLPYLRDDDWELPEIDRIKVSVARCARVSYLTHDGVRDIQADIKLYDRLVSADPIHASPLEHVATPWAWNMLLVDHDAGFVRPRVGNFLGWRQYRLEVEESIGYDSYL